jgi:hypothetical protein
VQLGGEAGELVKLAGRDVSGTSFEAQVLGELQRRRRDMRVGFKRLDSAITALKTGRR